jgi:hypothetical protein
MSVIHVRKIKGDRVSLPEKEFKKLLAKVEELEDIKAFDRAMKKIKSGKAEFVPLTQVVKEMPKR